MKKFILAICTIFCAALIAISIYQMNITPQSPADTPTKTTYVVKEYGGKVAVFLPQESEPLAVYEVYVHLLPENDIELLRKGIVVNDDLQLAKTLEDFGL